jgi:hypothetical protein
MKVYFGKVDADHPKRWVMTVDILVAPNTRSMAMYADKENARTAIKTLKSEHQIKAKLARCEQRSDVFIYYIYADFKTDADEAFFIMKVSEGIEI